MKRGQLAIYGLAMILVTLLVWAAINPTFEQIVSGGMTNLTPGSIDYYTTYLVPVFIPIVIIFGILYFSIPRR